MINKKAIIIAGCVVGAAGLWYLFRPELLFIDKTVDEAFPAGAVRLTGNAAPSSFESMSMASDTAGGAMDASAVPIASGMFHSGAHETKGTASIYELPGGKRLLRLTGFETSNGPDLRVLLIASSDAMDNDTVKSSSPIEIAPLKGNKGDQNYDLPATVDLAKYRAAVVWCNRFGVNFGTAPLH